MNICFMGSMRFAVPILEGLNKIYDIKLVVTQPDKPVGRKKVITSTPVKEKALELGLEVFQPISIKKEHNKITDLDLDYIVVAAYGQMIPEIVLTHAKTRAINVHASLLPKYRGGSPMHRAIQNGDSDTGVSIMFMAMKMDSGDVLNQRVIPIAEDDNVGKIEEKLGLIGRDLLIETLSNIDNIKPIKQDESKITFAYNIKPKEEKVDFSQSSKDVYNHVRGFYPWPLTYTVINGMKVKLYGVDYLTEDYSKNVGEIVKVDKQGVYVQTQQGVVVLKDIQLQGKKRMLINVFMNGVGKSLFKVGKLFQ